MSATVENADLTNNKNLIELDCGVGLICSAKQGRTGGRIHLPH
jgi:hypothetical protein